MNQKRKFPLVFFAALLLLGPATALAQEGLPDLVRRVKPSVLAITTFDSNGEALMTGSGFFINPGMVVTNLHVIRGATSAVVKTLDGKGRTYPVKGTVSVDEEGDLALLSIEMPAERTRPIEFATMLPEEGETIFVVGNPLKLEGSVSDGIVSAVREVPNVGKIIQVTAPVSHGNSGSPIFNLKGQVVGVITVKVTNGQNINLAISSGRVAKLSPGKLRPLTDIQRQEKSDTLDLAYRNGLESLWLGNYDNAVGFFENAVNKNPARAEAWIQVGYCKVKQGKNEEAIHAYQHALQLQPGSDDLRNKLGDAYYYAGRLTDAIDSYKEAVRLRPDGAEAYYNLAIAYSDLGDQVNASVEARTLQRLDDRLYRKFLSETARQIEGSKP